MNKEDTKQAILGFTEFFKGITGNQDLKIPDDIAKKYEIESNKWIPVSERLPENYGEYICTMSNDNVQECGFVPSGEKGLIPGWSTCEADGFKKLDYRDIIAWMPLPSSYQGE